MNQKQAYRIAEFCEAFGLGRTKVYKEIKAGRLKSYKVGRSRMISFNAAAIWQQSYEIGDAKKGATT